MNIFGRPPSGRRSLVSYLLKCNFSSLDIQGGFRRKIKLSENWDNSSRSKYSSFFHCIWETLCYSMCYWLFKWYLSRPGPGLDRIVPGKPWTWHIQDTEPSETSSGSSWINPEPVWGFLGALPFTGILTPLCRSETVGDIKGKTWWKFWSNPS